MMNADIAAVQAVRDYVARRAGELIDQAESVGGEDRYGLPAERFRAWRMAVLMAAELAAVLDYLPPRRQAK